jgi:hypothetical protein
MELYGYNSPIQGNGGVYSTRVPLPTAINKKRRTGPPKFVACFFNIEKLKQTEPPQPPRSGGLLSLVIPSFCERETLLKV